MDENITFLSQLINSMEEALIKLEESERNNNMEYSYRLKEFILNVQKKIDEELKR